MEGVDQLILSRLQAPALLGDAVTAKNEGDVVRKDTPWIGMAFGLPVTPVFQNWERSWD